MSTLIIGRGRVGKTGFTRDLVEGTKPEKLLIIAPRITNVQVFKKYNSIDWPVMTAAELEGAYNQSVDDYVEADVDQVGLVVLLTAKPVKGQPSIWEILRDERFRDFTIWAEELSVLTAETNDWNEFDYFIRVVGQNNQHFFANTHRLKRDVNPAWLANIQKIYFVGPLADAGEVEILYCQSNISTKLSKDEFAEKLKNQPEKYDWWSAHPNQAAAFLIYS